MVTLTRRLQTTVRIIEIWTFVRVFLFPLFVCLFPVSCIYIVEWWTFVRVDIARQYVVWNGGASEHGMEHDPGTVYACTRSSR
jgi:hypothetical protein